MDQYFDWHHLMSDATRVWFAKMRFLGQAKTYWTNVERLLTQRREELISTWGEMKLKLREKYLPPSYHQRFLNQWQKLTQGSKTVEEYITKFDEYLLRSGV